MRIISLLPSVTDTIVALGGAPMLVGVSHSCDAPAVAGLPRVTAATIDPAASAGAIDAAVRANLAAARPMYTLDALAIAQLRPDVVFTQALCEVCAVSDGQANALAAALTPRPEVVSLSGGTIDGLLNDIMTVGRTIGLADDAEELILGLRRRMRSVHGVLKAAHAPRPRVAVLEWADPLFAGGHWVPEQVARAGGTDVLAEPGSHSRTVSAQALRDARPEIVVVAPCGFDAARAADQARALLKSPPWPGDVQVWALDGNALTSRPGPHVVDGIEVMAHIFAPTLFAPPPHAQAQRIR